MAAAVTGSVQLQSHVFRNPSDFRDVEATPFARRTGAVTRTVTTHTRSCRFIPPYRFVNLCASQRITSHPLTRPPTLCGLTSA